tara:strand:- start:2092 stop:2892 length:801 start_codon:yes stop_codon:yes gene_type:complete
MICSIFSRQSYFKKAIKFILLKDPYNFFLKDNSSNFKKSKNFTKSHTSIVLKDNSSIEIKDNVDLQNVSIICSGNCKLIINENTKINNVSIKLQNSSKLIFSNDNLIGSLEKESMFINLHNGTVSIGEKSKLFLRTLQVRFGGEISVGKYAGIGDHTDIRCDEKIIIGDFLLCSYNVSIYDTNIHSTNPESRKQEIINQFPRGLSDSTKPKTSAIILGDNIWLGKNSAILKGSELASNSIVGMNTTISNIKEDVSKTFISIKPKLF